MMPLMSAKTILIAHRHAGVRDRFAAALADARHAYVTADSVASARARLADAAVPISLALIDLGLADDGVALVREMREASGGALPVVVFSGSVTSAAQVGRLAAMHVAYINEHAGTPLILPSLAPHLFPDNFNRRASARVAVGVPISYRAGPAIAGAVTLDVGKGGVAIRTMNPLEKGTTVQVKFRLPGTQGEIAASGRIAWSDRQVGMGVQFEKLSSNDQRSLDAFVDAHA
jgi:uncharacterized protein (TIGR02266 family)